ncbi:cis-Golgi t-SNARE syntaxin [Physocladia obscura]|uniref:Cis-Golgi t-SNARE syntaxin n=1 Tax=Physocladia obscura TaxID=109957 RepID=A0AAD5TA00_9FUNG|nr:cis-Golgi t-SNARE syntaxin [Physocladia obscura]
MGSSTIRDRSAEFHACADSLARRSNLSNSRLLNPNQNTKSEFAKAAAQIAREINATVAKLHSLTRLARKKTLFDDRPNEINELVMAIKQDITKVNRQIALLQNHQRQQQQHHQSQVQQRQVQQHSAGVIASLQTKLASTSSEFKSILEVRTQNMRDQKSRRDQYSAPSSSFITPPAAATTSSISTSIFTPASVSSSFSSSSSATGVPLFSGESSLFSPAAPSTHYSSLYNPDRNPYVAIATSENDDGTATDGLRNFVNGGNSSSVIEIGNQQMFLPQQNNATTMEYIESRGQAIESIESTIAELGQIYSQFTQILSQQREMVQRIDMNVMDTEVNVVNAHNELAKFLERLQGNRWLMIQVFAILVVFFMLFVVIA